MAHSGKIATRDLTGVNVPLFWPTLAAAQIGEQGLELYARNLEYLSEEAKIQQLQRPAPATANRVRLEDRLRGAGDLHVDLVEIPLPVGVAECAMPMSSVHFPGRVRVRA